MQIEEYRAHLEGFHEAVAREALAFYSGRKPSIELAGAYADYADLYDREAVQDLDLQLGRTPDSFPSRRKSLARLRSFAAEQQLISSVAVLDQRIVRERFGGTFTWDGAPVRFTRVPGMLGVESDAGRRRALREVESRRARDIEPACVERLKQLRAAAARLGYATPLEAMQSSTGVNYASLSGLLEILVAVTEPLYAERLSGSFGASLGLDSRSIAECDSGYWRTSNEPVGYFRDDLLYPTLERLVLDLGIRPESAGAVTMDIENRAGKPPGAWCIPVRVPREIYVVSSHGAGARDFAVLLHESGHAHHFAWTGGSVPAEYRLWGDRALGEAFGFLFERLMRNESWLMENIGLGRPAPFVRFEALEECFEIRRQIGLLRFQIALNGAEGFADAADRYAETMWQHTGLRHAPELWIHAAVDGIRSADYLRGWILEAILQEYLSTKFGAAWHRSRSAGNLLKEIWETGQMYSADELCRELGLGTLDPQILTDRLVRGLQR
jgi:hypothetical protein